MLSGPGPASSMVGLTLIGDDIWSVLSLLSMGKGLYFMKRIEEKLKRKVKYWRISLLQTNGRDRVSLGLFMILILVYMWWVSLIA